MIRSTDALRFVLVAAVAVSFAALSLTAGCGTQYGGPPSSIPRDPDSDDATSPPPGGTNTQNTRSNTSNTNTNTNTKTATPTR